MKLAPRVAAVLSPRQCEERIKLLSLTNLQRSPGVSRASYARHGFIQSTKLTRRTLRGFPRGAPSRSNQIPGQIFAPWSRKPVALSHGAIFSRCIRREESRDSPRFGRFALATCNLDYRSEIEEYPSYSSPSISACNSEFGGLRSTVRKIDRL